MKNADDHGLASYEGIITSGKLQIIQSSSYLATKQHARVGQKEKRQKLLKLLAKNESQ